MDCILRSKSCFSDTHTLSNPYPIPSLPKGSLYLSTSTPEPLSGTPDHYSCLGLCPLQYLHPMSSLRIDTRSYSTSYQVDGTPSEFPILIWKFPTLIWKFPTLIWKFPTLIWKFPHSSGSFPHSSGWFPRSSGSPSDAPPDLSASKVLQTSLGPIGLYPKLRALYSGEGHSV